MFDSRLRPLINPPLNRLGRAVAGLGIGADAVTLLGIAAGVAAGLAIAHAMFLAGLVLILLNRLLDGLDGAVARATRLSDFGGYLDIVADYAFYVAVPLGFGFAAQANLPYALVLVASFTLTGISFLSFAVIAAKRGLQTDAHGKKSFFYNTGLAEGAETIIAFVLMCLVPAAFPVIAAIFAGLCVVTAIQRSIAARAAFK